MIGGLQLAHVASHEGITAIEHIASNEITPIDYKLVSRCIYSNPEASSVGITEQQAKEQGFDVKVGKFPLKQLEKHLFMENQMVLSKLLQIKQRMIF